MALINALNILLCKVFEAFMQTDTNNTDLIAAVNIIIKVVAAKTLMQACLEIDHHKNVFNLLSETVVCTFTCTLRKTCSSKLTLKIYVKKN